jgi:HrpA-like RNA helicase
MYEFSLPEVKRAPLTEVCLQLKVGLKADPETLFAEMLDPPTQKYASPFHIFN